MTSSLFNSDTENLVAPLAERLRPQTVEEVLGQQAVTKSSSVLASTLKSKTPKSFVFWGPPGCGKTTLARIYAKSFDADYVSLSAVLNGVKDLKEATEKAKKNLEINLRTVVFVDEIHRFNKPNKMHFYHLLKTVQLSF